jgi:hypothetical protein
VECAAWVDSLEAGAVEAAVCVWLALDELCPVALVATRAVELSGNELARETLTACPLPCFEFWATIF